MQLPINIQDLLEAKSIESERLEFKAGWNPQAVLQTLCAFANDIHNWGGGYILIGIEECNGRPVLPPKGLPPEQLDAIQKEIVALGHRMLPHYHPVMAPVVIEGQHVLVLWAIGGQTRPYKAPVSLKKDHREYAYYVRQGSATLRAKGEQEKELLSLAASVPFDDRRHPTASLQDLDLGLMRAYLKQVNSNLFESASQMDFVDLCRRMNLVDGPAEFVQPKNVALMFFNEAPWHFFPYSQIEIAHFPQGLGASEFTETIFRGPLQQILNEALAHLQTHVILEKVIKYDDRVQSERFYNYPYGAIQEALCNAVYHRAYDIREPIEIRVLPDRLSIHSCPGPDRSIREQDMMDYRFLSRRYRNRRIGEFLKELEMTEGRGTGIPKILWEIDKNQSPRPVFHTDEERSFFLVEFPIHPSFLNKTDQVPGKYRASTGQVSELANTQCSEEIETLLDALSVKALSRRELQMHFGLSHRDHFNSAYLNPALDGGWIEMTLPDKPRSSKQKYRLTTKGQALYKELKKGVQ